MSGTHVGTEGDHATYAGTEADRGSHVGTEGDPDLPVGESPPADARACSKLDAAIVSAQSKQALMGLGWKPAIANAAVAAALEKLGPAVPLEQLIFEALRQCPRPSA